MAKISIIVPVYKVENYLSFCIESILSQTYQDFELILVDDGSPDRAGIICDDYAKKNNRVKVVHKINGGVSAARRDGVNVAQGEWIMFVDSDDAISPDCLEQLIKHESTNISVIEGKCIKFEKEADLLNVKAVDNSSVLFESNALDYANGIMQYVPNVFFATPWLKLIRASLLKETDALEIPPDIKNGEDQIMCLRVGANKNFIKAVKIDSLVYYYRKREGSAMSNVLNEDYNKKLYFYFSEAMLRYEDKKWYKYAIARFCYETLISSIKKKTTISRLYWARRSFFTPSSSRSKFIVLMTLILPLKLLYKVGAMLE